MRGIEKAFAELRLLGFLARMNFMCCRTCAGYEMAQKASALKDEGHEVLGCVFYTKQDHADRVSGDSFYLAFGDIETEKHGVIGLDTVTVGETVVRVLNQNGIGTEWDGSPDTRIIVEPESSWARPVAA